MKRFDLRGVKGVLSGLRGAEKSQTKQEPDIAETLTPDDFYCAKVARHGFPYRPSAIAWDPVQKLLAVGTRSAHIKILGKPGVDYHIQHEKEAAVVQIVFLINEGALVSACADNSVHLWNYRQKVPEIVNTLRFNREQLTKLHLPYQAKWLYVGTERGNVHLVNIESFTLSGYVINWNKCMEMASKTHPGAIVHLSDNPVDSNKLLIGFSTGLVVLWDLKQKAPECRFRCTEQIRDIEWHQEGRQFMCAHTDGTLSTWSVKNPQKPCCVTMPHQRTTGEGCRPITRLQWKSMKNGDPYVIFSGGLSTARQGKVPSLTLQHGKSTTVLEMEHRVIDFIVLCNAVWPHEYSDPYAIVVLMSADIATIDLTTPGYPIFENPYPTDLHESPLTTMAYYSDCASDLIPAFYSCGMKQKRKEFSTKPFPIDGGVWGTSSCSYSELLITGHADGSMKFWDSSGVTLQYLYKVKSSRLFERPQTAECSEALSVKHVFLEEESRMLVLAASHHIVLFEFNRKDSQFEVTRLDIGAVLDACDDHSCFNADGADNPTPAPRKTRSSNTSGSPDRPAGENPRPLLARKGSRIWPAGYQPTLVCCLVPPGGGSSVVPSDQQPSEAGSVRPTITAVCLNSSYGLLAVGTSSSLFVIDVVQRTVVMNVAVAELYGSGEALKTIKSPMKCFEDYSYPDPKSPLPSDQGSTPATTPLATSPPSSTAPGVPTHTVTAEGEDPAALGEGAEGTAGSSPVKPPRRSKMEKAAREKDRGRHSSANAKLPVADGQCSSQEGQGHFPLKEEDDAAGEGSSVPAITVEHTASPPARPPPPTAPTPAGGGSVPRHQPLTKTSSAPAHGVGDPPAPPPPRRTTEGAATSLRPANPSVDKDDAAGQLYPAPSPSVNGPATHHHRQGNVSLHHSAPQHPVVAAYAAGSTGPAPAPAAPVQAVQNNSMMSRMRRLSTRLGLTGTRKTALPTGASAGGCTAAHHNVIDLDADDKPDGLGGAVSQSSSLSSLDHVGAESVQCLVFAEGYSKRTDLDTAPGLWVGTSAGNMTIVLLNIPAAGEMRLRSSVILNPSGTVFHAKGTILEISFLNCQGLLIPSEAEIWADKEQGDRSSAAKPGGAGKEKRLLSRLSRSLLISSGTGEGQGGPPGVSAGGPGTTDQQMLVVGTDLQVYVMAMPSQTVLYRVRFPEDRPAVHVEAIVVKDSVCLTCLLSSGHVSVYSLPSLRPLLDMASIGSCDQYASRTWGAGNHGHALFMCSPLELCKLTLSSDMCRLVNDMMGELFSPKDNPEYPKPSFFKNLFATAPSALDREELFGEHSGKASSSVAQRVPGPAHLQASAASATSEISRARQALDERGEKLSQLDDKTSQMRSAAEEFAQNAHKIANQYSQKKWYHF